MRSYEFRMISRNEVEVVVKQHAAVVRSLSIKVGDTYWVQPDNPSKKKHRGRQCIVKSFRTNDLGHVTEAVVTFLDNQNSGRVDLEDLVIEYSSEVITAANMDVPRYKPQDVPDDLFTRSELKLMGRVELQPERGFVTYPEKHQEFPLFAIHETRTRKKQATSLQTYFTVEDVLEKRRNAIAVRKQQMQHG